MRALTRVLAVTAIATAAFAVSSAVAATPRVLVTVPRLGNVVAGGSRIAWRQTSVSLVSAAHTSAATPRVILRASGAVPKFSVGGGSLAYAVIVHPFDPDSGGCAAVRRIRLRDGKNTPVVRCPKHASTSGGQVGVAVASSSSSIATTALTFGETGNGLQSWTGWALTTTLKNSPQPVAHGGHRVSCGGTDFDGLAGGSGWFAYALLDWTFLGTDQPNCPFLDQGEQADAGEIQIVPTNGGAPHQLTGAPGASAIAGGVRDIAIRPFVLPGPANGSDPAVGSSIQIWQVSTGTLVSTVTPSGTIISFALGDPVLSVLTRNSAGRDHIIRYNLQTGTLMGSIPLSGPVTSNPTMYRNVLAYSVGRKIVARYAYTGQVAMTYTASGTPRGVTTNGRSVFWRQNRTLLSLPI